MSSQFVVFSQMNANSLAMDCSVGDFIEIQGQGDAVYEVESIPRLTPVDYLVVRRIQGSSFFISGLLEGFAEVKVVPSWKLKPV